MTGRDNAALHAAALLALAEATRAGGQAADAEAALRHLTQASQALLGDRAAHTRPGALKAGERQFFVAGVFLVTPDRRQNLLVADVGFPAEQRRLRIPVDLGHPGWVVANRAPLLLADTDDDPGFRQILKTARMGSAIYGPMVWRGQVVGQLFTAAQARHTFAEVDLDVLVAFAEVAAALYIAHDGPAFLAAIA